MFHSLMGIFQLELFIFITYFFTVVPLTSCFLSCRPSVVNATFSTGLVVSSFSWLGQLCRIKDERPTGNKTQLVSETTVEKQVIKINNSFITLIAISEDFKLILITSRNMDKQECILHIRLRECRGDFRRQHMAGYGQNILKRRSIYHGIILNIGKISWQNRESSPGPLDQQALMPPLNQAAGLHEDLL